MRVSNTIVNHVLRVTFVSSNLSLRAATLLSIHFLVCTCSKEK